jgi:transcriptional regulator with XRE-family HTH domain
MGRTPKKLPAPPKKLFWRRTRIREWREAAHLTQQNVADALAERGVDLSRESIQRIEAGTQRPLITAIEAMAGLFKTDVHSLLNRSPGDAADLAAFERLDARTRRILLRAAQDTDES